MRYISFLATAIFTLAATVPSFCQIAHQPGKIIRPATTPYGKGVLDPNCNGWVSASGSAWDINGDDTTSSASEIHYKAIMPYGGEPCCDLRRGPDHRFSDFVPDNNNNGVYLHFVNSGVDSTSYLKIRMRMGTIIPGSKGFSLLIDTDSAYGYGKDANYVEKTTGINGNKGFEIEVVLETGFRVAVYNIDGRGNPTDGIDIQDMAVNAHRVFYDTDWEARSQVSFAGTTESGDPDYFIDWYVRLSELKLMKNTSGGTSFIQSAFQRLRIVPTTVMAPKPSTAGPISDIYGSDDSTSVIFQPKICLPCNEISGLCTVAPVVTSAATTGANNIKGTWTKGSYGGSIATIYIYKNGDTSNVLATVPNISSGASWQATVGSLVAGDIITAKAKGNSIYESRWCYTSNSKAVGSCDTRPTPITVNTFTTNKGMDGTGYLDNVSGSGSGSANGAGSGINYVHIYKVSPAGSSRLGTLEYPSSYSNRQGNGTVTGRYNLGLTSGTWFYSGGSGGPNDPSVTAGQYEYLQETPAGCKSASTFFCRTGNSGTTDVPTVTSDGGNIYTTSTTITGGITPVAIYPTIVRIYLDSMYVGNATVTNAGTSSATWSYTFSQTLTATKKVWIRTQAAETGGNFYCEGSLEKTIVTACTNAAPIFNIDSTTSKIGEGIALSGTGTAGGSLTIKDNGNTTVATLTIGTDGTWSALNSGVTFSDGFAGYARTSDAGYYATLTTSGCATAATSATWLVAAKTTETYCAGTLEFSTSASTGGSYTSIVTGGTLTGTKLTSDAKWIKGSLGGTPTANTKTVKIYVNDGLVGRSTVPALSTTFPDIYVGGYLAQGDILTLAITENDGSSAEMVCASIQIICDCATANKPAAPAVNVAASTLTVTRGAGATIKVESPEDNNFISVKNKYNSRSLFSGVYYTGGSYTVTGRFFGVDETLTIVTGPLDSSQTATIVSSRIGGTETCTESTDQALVVNSALPVTLTDFKGLKNDKAIVLSWTTSTEINFSHFEIERSSDGISFEKIGTKAGTGYLSGPNYYSYTDHSPFAGNNFYRLKMVDVDGKKEYSKVIVLKSSGSSVVINSIRPNPFVNEIRISAVFAYKTDIRVLFTDAAGRTLRMQSFAGLEGLNEIKMTDLGTLPSGTYMVSVVAGAEIFRYKILKVTK